MDLRRQTRPWPTLGLLVVLALVATACAAGSLASPAASETASDTPVVSTLAPPTDAPSAAPTATAGGDVSSVKIRGSSFGPAAITVAVGGVTFTNSDSVAHTVTEGENGAAAAGARFDLVIAPGETIVIGFAEPGDYRITCQFHPEMHLLVNAH